MIQRQRDSTVEDQIREWLEKYGDKPELRALGWIIQDNHALVSDNISSQRSMSEALMRLTEQLVAHGQRFEQHEKLELDKHDATVKMMMDRFEQMQKELTDFVLTERTKDAERRGRDEEKSKALDRMMRLGFVALGVFQSALMGLGGWYYHEFKDLSLIVHDHKIKFAEIGIRHNIEDKKAPLP